ncbi:MAG: hypothetical protein HQL50_06015, partial [Magnetococcales bacterium]|nr:hypothetical protein [Magnetococcales bacterium]
MFDLRLLRLLILLISMSLVGCQATTLGMGSSGPETLRVPENRDPNRSVLEYEPDAFQEIWNESLPKLEKAVAIKEKQETAPRFALLGDSQRSLKGDFNDILEKLSIILSERNLSEWQEHVASIKGKIKQEKDAIAHYKEQRAGAPTEHIYQTTKAGYDTKIADAKVTILTYENDLVVVQERFANELRHYGIEMTAEQVEVLLTRVDADDILQMTVVFDSIKGITSRLMELTRESGEDLNFAKRYYGMHVVLLEMIIHIQDSYISQVDDNYLPRLNKITEKTRVVNREAKEELRRETDPGRKKIYQANLKAHDLTLRAANLYRRNLHTQKSRVRKARAKAVRDLRAADN